MKCRLLLFKYRRYTCKSFSYRFLERTILKASVIDPRDGKDCFNKRLACWVKISADILNFFFLIFPQEIGFDISCEYISLKCQCLFSWKKKKKKKKKKTIMNLSSAEFAQRVLQAK